MKFRNDISEHDLKSISTLKNVYDFDFENNQVEIPFGFEEAGEIIDSSVSEENNILISKSFLEDMMDKLTYIPKSFHIDLLFKFERFNGCSGKDILRSMLDGIEENYCMAVESNKRNYFTSLSYIICCVFFSLLGSIQFNVDYASGIGTDYTLIIKILLDNVALLLLWQGGYILLDILHQKGISDATLYRRINSVSIIDENNKVISANNDEIFRYLPFRGFREKLAYAMLLLCNAYMLTISVVEVISYANEHLELSSVDKFMFPLEWIFVLITAISSLALYFDKGRIARHSFTISVSYLIVLAVYNGARLAYIFTNNIPFDSNDFLFTYLVITAVISRCIYTIDKERNRRIEHLCSDISVTGDGSH